MVSGGGGSKSLSGQGFTLAESLVTILILGIMAALTLPIVRKSYPDKLEALRRKSYYILEQTVTQMYTDDSMYRKRMDGDKEGFRNTETIKLEGKTYGGNTKFCELFAKHLVKREGSLVKCISNDKSVTSADNVDWYLPVTNFTEIYVPIKFDVNSVEEPNCEYNAKSCPKPDTFTYYINAYGRVVKDPPVIKQTTYCIITEITGKGHVLPSNSYCGLSNGTYKLQAVPDEGWLSNWQNNERTVTINGQDVQTSVRFSESPKACIHLNVNCSESAEKCGKYEISKGTFLKSSNVYSACNLTSGSYEIRVTPTGNYKSNWTEDTVYLNGDDITRDVTLYEPTFCAVLDVSCPAGVANLCGRYMINGIKEMNANGGNARLCNLVNGNYELEVHPLQAGGKDVYKPTPKTQSFRIANSDWKGSVLFEKLIKNCREDGYFEVGGKKFSCPFRPSPLSKVDCEAEKSKLGIKNCYSDTDYFAGAVKQCGGVSYLPTRQDTANIAQLIYPAKTFGTVGRDDYSWSASRIDDIVDREFLSLLYTNPNDLNMTIIEREDTLYDIPHYYCGRYFYLTNTHWSCSLKRSEGMYTVCVIK